MVIFQPDEICRHQCDFLQHISAADGDSAGGHLHFVQRCPVYSDAGEVSVRYGGGRIYNGYPADSDHWRFSDVKPGNHRSLSCQDL